MKDELNEKYKDNIDDVEVEINIVGEENIKEPDDDIDIYNLEDWEKDLVKKGEYDPWDFEEEDLEEDDYYEDE